MNIYVSLWGDLTARLYDPNMGTRWQLPTNVWLFENYDDGNICFKFTVYYLPTLKLLDECSKRSMNQVDAIIRKAVDGKRNAKS